MATQQSGSLFNICQPGPENMTDIPPPGPIGWFDRLHAWMDGRPVRRTMVVIAAFLVGWTLLFGGWIAVAMLRGSTERNAGAVALLYVIMPFLAVILLFLLHRMTYRRFWDDDRKNASGDRQTAMASPPGGKLFPPAPRIDWPLHLRLRHGLFYLLAIAGLLFSFMPYENQIAISRFMVEISSGSATRRQLTGLLFGYLPMILFALLALALIHRQQRRRDADLLDARERLLLRAEMNWLFSFGVALGSVILFSQVFGNMIITRL